MITKFVMVMTMVLVILSLVMLIRVGWWWRRYCIRSSDTHLLSSRSTVLLNPQTLLGEGASVVLDGQKVLPSRAQQAGFAFKYREVSTALQSIMSR
jgi:uncharacterized membrane protein YqiK